MRLSVSSIAAISALALIGFTTPTLADAPSAPAQQPSTSNPPAQKAPPPAKPALICRSQVTTGSLLPVRECHTAEQWVDIRTHGKDQLGLVATRPNGLGGQ